MINRITTLTRRHRAARRFGLKFNGMRHLALPRSIRIDGETIPLSFPDDPSLANEMVSIWFDDEYGLRGLNHAPRKVVDIGGNVGLFSLMLKNTFPKAIVHAYEPNPESARHFAANVERLSSVDLFREGVANVCGSADILQFESTRLSQTQVRTDGSGAVRLAGLDEVMSRIGGDVDLLKIDCEGAEWDIMQNRAAIREASRIHLEYHLWVGKELSALEEIAHNIGFEITFLAPEGNIGFAYMERR